MNVPPRLPALFRETEFARVWVVGASVGVMRWLEILAVGVFALQATDSAFAVALMYFARTLPTPLCGPVMGSLAERCSRRTILAVGLGAMGAGSAVLALLALSGGLEVWQVALGAAFNGAIWSMEHTVRRTILRDIVGVERAGSAISFDSGTQNATRMVGPLAGGAVFAAVGLEGAYLIGVFVYAAALWGVLGLRVPLPDVAPTRTAFLASLVEGVRYVRGERLLLAVLAVTVVLNMFGFAYTAMIPVIGERQLGLSPAGIGALMSSEGAGAIAGALLLAMSVRTPYYARILTAGAAAFLCSVAVLSFASSATLAVPVLVVGGIGIAAFAAMQSTILLTVAAPHMRSRMMGLLVVCIGAGPLGVLQVGLLAEYVGASMAIRITALVGLAGLALCVSAWPELLRPVALRRAVDTDTG